MKRILVTGGSGFIGSHLCAALLNSGNRVYCLDNLSTGSKNNVSELFDNDLFSFIEHDVKNPFFVEVDEIYNLACPASPQRYQHDSIDTIKTCVLGAINALDLATECNAKILQTSTSEVYGDPLISPQQESYWGNVNPLGPRSCYDEGKRCAESLFINYHRQYNTKIKIARIFNTFGPKLYTNDGRVISNFIVQALTGQDLTIYGSGNHTRSFCYIDDTVRGLIALMNSSESTIGPINIGNPGECSIVDLANHIIQLTQSTSRIVFLDRMIDDPQRRCPDIAMAKQLLSWAPAITLDQGLQNTIDYFKRVI